MTEVENVKTEVKRTTPIPRENIQSLLDQQKGRNVKATFAEDPDTMGKHPGLFHSQEKKEQFKRALKSQEDRIQRLSQIVSGAPTLELKVSNVHNNQVLSSAFLEKGKVLRINAQGLENDN